MSLLDAASCPQPVPHGPCRVAASSFRGNAPVPLHHQPRQAHGFHRRLCRRSRSLPRLQGRALLGVGALLHDNERYVLLACAFSLLLLTFTAFLKGPDLGVILAFFGLLYVSVDLLMSVGFRLKGVLLTSQPWPSRSSGPSSGMAMKGGKKRP